MAPAAIADCYFILVFLEDGCGLFSSKSPVWHRLLDARKRAVRLVAEAVLGFCFARAPRDLGGPWHRHMCRGASAESGAEPPGAPTLRAYKNGAAWRWCIQKVMSQSPLGLLPSSLPPFLPSSPPLFSHSFVLSAFLRIVRDICALHTLLL
eukprot:3396120-Pyramimonas_sp.AAC.1